MFKAFPGLCAWAKPTNSPVDVYKAPGLGLRISLRGFTQQDWTAAIFRGSNDALHVDPLGIEKLTVAHGSSFICSLSSA